MDRCVVLHLDKQVVPESQAEFLPHVQSLKESKDAAFLAGLQLSRTCYCCRSTGKSQPALVLLISDVAH